MIGIERIADERQRQIDVEGWTPEHDDQYIRGELACAAACYADYAVLQTKGGRAYFPDVPPAFWPWAKESWKPSYSPMRNLEKAGALIAAEIDRLERAKGEI